MLHMGVITTTNKYASAFRVKIYLPAPERVKFSARANKICCDSLVPSHFYNQAVT